MANHFPSSDKEEGNTPSLHSALCNKHFSDPGTIPSGLRPPFKLGDLVGGGNLAYLIRIAGRRILAFGSMNYIEREVDGLRPDVVLMGAGESRSEIYDYAGRLMRVGLSADRAL
jgi:hypothetical protein